MKICDITHSYRPLVRLSHGRIAVGAIRSGPTVAHPRSLDALFPSPLSLSHSSFISSGVDVWQKGAYDAHMSHAILEMYWTS